MLGMPPSLYKVQTGIVLVRANLLCVITSIYRLYIYIYTVGCIVNNITILHK